MCDKDSFAGIFVRVFSTNIDETLLSHVSSMIQGPVGWSPDATALSYLAIARETTEAGPRVTFEEVYAHFRSLNLAARNVSRVRSGTTARVSARL